MCRNIELRKNEMKITKKEFIMMLGGMFLMSAAVYYEMMPNNLVLGSLSGLVLVLVKIIPLPVSTITFVLNMGGGVCHQRSTGVAKQEERIVYGEEIRNSK